ncbi:MAG: DUF2058 domain-containing protein [Desulfotalea sp.]
MSNPFQDQFLKLGLVDQKQVGKAKKKQHTKKKKQTAKKGVTVVDENALLVQQAQEKKRARDLELNRQREEKLRKREIAATVKQIIEQNLIAKDPKGVAYRFTAGTKIQRIFVSQEVAGNLSAGRLGVVRLASAFEVLPKANIEKINSLDDKVFTFLAELKIQEDDEDDPYADYKVPDDLVW